MKDIEELIKTVESIIKFHETDEFSNLSSYILEKEIKASTWFTNKRFTEVSEMIRNEIGSFISLDYISTLNRRTSYLTLWKAKYSKSNDEVLWQIIFDSESNKIKLLHINWEQI